MKTAGLKTAGVSLCAFLVAGSAVAAERYGMESGYIKYDSSNGSEELYWDNYGEQEVRYSETSVTMFGMTQESRTTTIIDGDWSYTIDQDSDTAMRINHQEMMEQMMSGSTDGAAPGAGQAMGFTDEMIERFGGERVGSETVLGKPTQVYEVSSFADSKVWLYEGVPLKTEMEVMGMSFNTVAVEFQENVSVDSSRFEIPDGIEVVDFNASDMMPDAAQMEEATAQMSEMRNDPDVQEAMRQMREMQNSPEYAEAMRQMEQMQNSPEYAEAMREMQELQNSPEFAEAMEQMRELQNNPDFQEAMSQISSDATERMERETQDAVREGAESGIDEAVNRTRDAIGSGIRSIFGN